MLKSNDLPPIIEAVKFRMEQYGHSQTEACRIMGIQQTHFSEFLNGKREASLKTMVKLHKYGIPAEVLLQ